MAEWQQTGIDSFLTRNDDPLLPPANMAVPFSGRIGVLLQNGMHRRLIESAATHLDLKFIDLAPSVLQLERGTLPFEDLRSIELIVADDHAAEQFTTLLAERDTQDDAARPTIIIVRPELSGEAVKSRGVGQHFDAVLQLPQSPADVSAQLSLILYAHRAFTKRLQSAIEELHLNRRIFRSVTSGISVANAALPDLPLTYVNPAFEVMTGYTFEEVQGKNCRFLQGEEKNQPSTVLIREAIRDGREVTALLKNFHKNGTPFWNELSLSPIRNRAGEVTHIVGIQNDVTARIEFERSLRESEKLAAVGRLASSIAHEINNPLEAVMNLVYLAQTMEISAEAREMLVMADNELQRVKNITSQSLRFYKQSTAAQATTCAELIGPVLALYASRFANTHVTVERRERSSQSIVCMESEIRQVLNNLVSNAIDAMSANGGTLRVRTRDVTDWRSGKKGVRLTFADGGSGIPDQLAADIFKPFFTTKGILGTGLGLWISNEIVQRHQGHLLVRSSTKPGASGTVFQLFLPLQGA